MGAYLLQRQGAIPTKGPEKVSFLCKEADPMYRIIGIIIVTVAFIWWIYKYDKTLRK